MVARRDVDLLWRPSEDLNVAHHELQDAQLWKEGKNMKSVPLTPLPKKTVVPVSEDTPQQGGDMPAKPPAVAMPKHMGAELLMDGEANHGRLVPHDKGVVEGNSR